MSYGAFVKLEEGIEGLVHISEMSWTKRISHPNELVHIDDEIEVVVLGINKEKQEISLGMKQTQENPWDKVAERYPPGTMVKGTVRNLTNYGAFIEIEEGIDGLLHVSDMSWTRKISHPSEVVEKGQEIECRVLSVDQERRRIALGLKQLEEDPWATDIPNKYQPGQVVKGTVTKITNFGVFVGLENGLEGLLHISELADHKVENPEDVVKVGDEIEVKILRVDTDERKIGLSREARRVERRGPSRRGSRPRRRPKASRAEPCSATELKGGVGGDSGPLIKPAAPRWKTGPRGRRASRQVPRGRRTGQSQQLGRRRRFVAVVHERPVIRFAVIVRLNLRPRRPSTGGVVSLARAADIAAYIRAHLALAQAAFCCQKPRGR